MYKKWHPKLKRGFFYVGDQQFYLFADKVTRTISESKFYEWTLADYPSTIIDCLVGGVVISPSDIVVDEWTVRVRSTVATAPVTLTYTTKSISYGEITQGLTTVTLDPSVATICYYLDPIPKSGYPIILTDDSVGIADDPVHHEFSVDRDTGEITFHSTIPTTGTFEYEGSVEDYATIEEVDLNPANIGDISGLLNIGLNINPGINSELY